jgi:hypothetical protein
MDGAAFTRARMDDPAFRAGADLASAMIDLGLLRDNPRVTRNARVGDLVEILPDWSLALAPAERSVLLAEPGKRPSDFMAPAEPFSLSPAAVEAFAALRVQTAVRTDFGYVLRFAARPWAMALNVTRIG